MSALASSSTMFVGPGSSPPPSPSFASARDYFSSYPRSSGSTVPFEISSSEARRVLQDEEYETASAAMAAGAPSVTDGTTSQMQIDDDDVSMRHTFSEATPATTKNGRWSATSSPEPGLELLGRGMREMVEVINRLRQVGVEDYVIPLPQIAVVGNQSAGKSSLIEAISGIRVPRYTGTCTRCPLEINLTDNNLPGAQWTCEISLRHKYCYTGPSPNIVKSEPRTGSGWNNAHSLGPWLENDVAEDTVFKNITDKNEVESVLVRAQKAILNPSQDWKDFLVSSSFNPGLEDRENEDFQVKFSPNIVRMTISGPGLPNLSLIDLPGIIEAPESDDEMYLVELIKDLVKNYISNDDCLILLAVPMTDDAENQSASWIAKSFGKDRCIGALTKPDMVQPGEHGKWRKIMVGEKHELYHGYFVTKQPSQARLVHGIDHGTARAEEMVFFQTTHPWTELSEVPDRNGRPLGERFGTLALQRYLSKSLTELIRKSLPNIIAKVNDKASKVHEELLSLPEPPGTNLLVQLSTKLEQFRNAVIQEIDGTGEFCRLSEEWQKYADVFRRAIKNSHPVLESSKLSGQTNGFTSPEKINVQRPTPRTPGTPTPMSKPKAKKTAAFISLDSDDDESAPSPSLVKSKKRPGPSESLPSTPLAKRTRTTTIAKLFTLEEIRRECRRVSNNRIRHQVDPKATNHLTKISIKDWNIPMESFLEKTFLLLQKMVNSVISDVFSEYRNTALFEEVLSIKDEFLQTVKQDQLDAMQEYYRKETSVVFTHKDLASEKKTILRSLEENREQTRREEIEREHLLHRQQLEEHGTPQQKAKAKVVPPPVRLEPDEFHKELEYLAEVRVYYDHAAGRFVDNVCISMLTGIFSQIREYLQPELKARLGVEEPGADERCQRLMVENDGREQRRRVLKEKKRQLDKAQDELARYR